MVRAVGFGDAEIIEIVLHVALNTLTNYVNEVAETDIDFPKVAARKRPDCLSVDHRDHCPA
jgi:hypothetical protein